MSAGHPDSRLTVPPVTFFERFRRRSPQTEATVETPYHGVHFYDQDESLLTRLEAYVLEGVRLGQTVVIIATPEHRQMLRERLSVWDLEDAFLGLDAQQTLDRFMVDGLPDPHLFDLTIGTLVRDHADAGLRAYGEMVSLLWKQQYLEGTVQLEKLWNGLQQAVPFPLLCAYPAADFEGVAGMAEVCEQHSHVVPLAA